MDQILAFLNNQQYAIILGSVVGVVMRFLPAFKNVSNEVTPFLVVLTAWATNVFGPGEAHAAFLGGALGSLGSIFIPVMDMAVSKFLHETILRGLYKGLRLKKAEPTQVVEH